MANQYPILFFEGPDATGKTTQAFLACSFLKKAQGISVAYCSFPDYETPIGQAIGRCLGRWGDREKIAIPTAENFALLYALNRLEILPYLEKLSDQGYLIISNRGPFANAFNVARQVLENNVAWEKLSDDEKNFRLQRFLDFDSQLIQRLRERGELVNLFLMMNTETSMRLAASRAEKTNGLTDENEKNRKLQELTAAIFGEIAQRKVDSRPDELSVERIDVLIGEKGIFQTSQAVIEVIRRHFPSRTFPREVTPTEEMVKEIAGYSDRENPFDYKLACEEQGEKIIYDIGDWGRELLRRYPTAREILEISRRMTEEKEGGRKIERR